MIVANKEKTVETASEIADRLMVKTSEETLQFTKSLFVDDPAESIYMALQITSIYCARMCLILGEYCKTYMIEKFNPNKIFEIISIMIKENIEANKGK